MRLFKRKKCRHCKDLFYPDPRNAKRQKYCRKVECRNASKAASQQRWLNKPENRDYFHGPENVKRVQQWRKANPGYWHRKSQNKENALQDPLNSQLAENKGNTVKFECDALQDLLTAQPLVLIGLIANFTGSALQDDMAMTIRRLQQLGCDIVNNSTLNKGGQYGIQVSHPSRTCPPSAQAV